MKNKILVLVLFILSSCTPAIVNKIVITDLNINQLEISSDSIPDTIFLKKLMIDSAKYNYIKKEGTLEISEFKIAKLLISNANGDSLIKHPVIKELIIDKVDLSSTLQKKYQYENAIIIIKKFYVNSLFINKSIPFYDSNIIRIEKLDALYKAEVQKIDSFKLEIIKKTESDPNHVARGIFESKYFKEIDLKMKRVLYYIDKNYYTEEESEYYISEIYNIDNMINNLKKSVFNPIATTIDFSNDVFFKPGKYKISEINKNTEIDKYLKTITILR